ncbi:MAG: methyltransferase domain-containing protein [Thiohalocapsa sp. PB-PSB1]|jgi:SAM-dependent methyltransferase|nr:MAG: hypothetical protein N838_22695 [Thiohalocapsa sp. PB-PSB1]QQO52110.1 MAG: methyltransferase domain-containing protein [Thiohalocapsa sp. PB-PSB1]HCS92152.1 methyltransferase domain-containing protein [Chromatiaceae bacterium]
MKPCHPLDADPLARLSNWYDTPLGRQVAQAESACLERLLIDTFGHYLIQVGAHDQFQQAVKTCRIHRQVVLGETLDNAQCVQSSKLAGILSRPDRLPLASASVDVVVLPHTLDFCLHAHEVLREVERVLIPEGRVILFCFNPLSLWGLMRWMPRRRPQVPWCGGQLTPFRIGDWLQLLGLQQETREMLVFRPPLQRACLPQLDRLERIGSHYWPIFGGVFGVRAVKRVKALTPLRPSWVRRTRLLPGRPMEPTARKNGHVGRG